MDAVTAKYMGSHADRPVDPAMQAKQQVIQTEGQAYSMVVALSDRAGATDRPYPMVSLPMTVPTIRNEAGTVIATFTRRGDQVVTQVISKEHGARQPQTHTVEDARDLFDFMLAEAHTVRIS